MGGKVFAVDDQAEVLELLAERLGRRGREVIGFADGDKALVALADDPTGIDLVVLDIDLGPGKRDGLALLADLRRSWPDLPVIILTGKGTVDDAVRAMRLGATDFIEKDPRLGQRLELQMDKLDRMWAVLRDNRRLRAQNRLLAERAGLEQELIGAEGGLREVMLRARRLSDIPRPVLILGERGTGKELVAAALHRLGSRRDGPFVTINCAALPAGLAEAELFGTERGAYTDAGEGRPGKFELADGGTLFLDEIGNMPLPLQQKILRVLEYQTIERVGGGSPRRVDVRTCAATNADLQVEMEAGRFRRDLYDRLAFDKLVLPPLRERRGDIAALGRHFLAGFRREVAGVHCLDFSDTAMALLERQPFPGNVRELKHLVERAAYRCRTERIEPADLDLGPAPGPSSPAQPAGGLRERVAEFERRLVAESIENHPSLVEAARALGLGYDQMRRLVRKHRLRPGD